MKDVRWKGAIRALIYPVQFSKEPAIEADRVLEHLLESPGSCWTRASLENAVRKALSLKEPLAGLIPQPHSEAVLRAYLEAVLKKLSPG